MAESQNTYTGDGSSVLFSFTFPYLDTDDVKVSFDGVLVEPTEYSFNSPTTILFGSAPADGVSIRIFRLTGTDNTFATFYAGSAIRSVDLNNNFEQGLFVAQEAQRDSSSAADAFDFSVQALATAQSAKDLATTADANASAALTEASNASASAASASDSAAQASTDASASNSAASQAQSDAQTASSAAEQAATDAASAQALAVQADTDATNALGIANTASANASTALATANNAESTAIDADSKADTAISDSADAVATANAAASAVSDVVTYTIVADVASIPGSPANGDRIEVSDSTGIESFSPLAGVPASYVGDSGKAARIAYAAGSWSWVNYVVIDPDARYATISGQTFTGAVAAPSFSGPLTGDTSGTHTGPVTGDVTGNTAGTHTGPVTGDVTGTATQASKVRAASTPFGASGNRPIACFGSSSEPTPDAYTNLKYAETNPPTISGNGVISAPGGFQGNLDGIAQEAYSAQNAALLDTLDSTQFARSDADTTILGVYTFTDSVVLGPYTRINDDDGLWFGTDNDARLMCNGSHLYLDLKATIGNFYI